MSYESSTIDTGTRYQNLSSSMRKMVFASRGGAIVPGISRAAAVQSSNQLPTEVDVVVIGGGIVGCCTALTLAERGVTVALCEKGVIAGEASGRSLGLIDGTFADPSKVEIISRSKQLWSEMERRVSADIGYRKEGMVALFRTDKELALAEDWVRGAGTFQEHGVNLLSLDEVRGSAPGGSMRWVGGIRATTDAQIESRLAAPAIASAAAKAGAHIFQYCAVRGLETEAGEVSGVVTERGVIRAKAVVLAGGYWSPFFTRSLNLSLPQFTAFSSMASIAPINGPDYSFWGNDLAWRREPDGGYSVCTVNGAAPITPTTLRYLPRLIPAIKNMWSQLEPVISPSTFWKELNTPVRWPLDKPSPFERNRVLQPEIRTEVMAGVIKNLAATFPVFRTARVRELWAGALVSTLDNMPVISSVTTKPGLYIGSGFYYGMTMGPAAGEALADLVMGNTPKIDMSDFVYERFSDGRKLQFRY